MLKPGMYSLEAVQELEKKLPNLKSQDIEDLEAHAQWCSSISVREKMSFLGELMKDILRDYGDGTGIFSYLGSEQSITETMRLIDDCIAACVPLKDLLHKLVVKRDKDKRRFETLTKFLEAHDKEDDNEIVDYDAQTIAMVREIKNITEDKYGEFIRFSKRYHINDEEREIRDIIENIRSSRIIQSPRIVEFIKVDPDERE